MSPRPTAFTPDELRTYYDENTAAFEKLGQGGASIHRAVWGPGVPSRDNAFRYVDDLILAELKGMAITEPEVPRLLDLGCGLGASLIYLSSRVKLEGLGVTISPVQVAQATRRLEAAGLADVRCIEASFTALPADLGRFDLAFAIESFVLSPTADAFFREASAHLRAGGKLVVCDDFLTERGAHPRSAREARWLDDFRYGWLVSSLSTPGAAAQAAARHHLHLSRNDDLTPFLELRRPRDKLLSVLVAAGRHVPIPGQLWRSWIGGNGLQFGLMGGLLEYRFLVFEKTEP